MAITKVDHLHPDLNDLDSFAFDEDPDAFVMLSVSPIVFTMRGIGYFSPRFKYVGIALNDVCTAEQFHAAYHSWTLVEAELLMQSIEKKAAMSYQASEHSVLLAALQNGHDAALVEADRLDHKHRANLKIVP